jgi:putative acetyltransferase
VHAGSLICRDARAGDEPAIRAVVAHVLTEYGLSLDPVETDADLNDVVASYAAGGGVFRVLVDDADRIVGCGGLCRLSDSEAELRKMYVLPEARGHGHGRVLLDELLAAARARGFTRVVLETASVLKTAREMYQRRGFKVVERPHLASRCDQAFALEL